MHIATVKLASAAPYSQSRNYSQEIELLPRETHDAFDKRTWRNKCHAMGDGHVYIPPMAFKQGLDTAAKMRGIQIPGKGRATYTKYFLAGVLVMEPLVLPLTRDDLAFDDIFANADGIRGSSKRVWRRFPRIDKWEGEVTFHILADEITEEVFAEVLKQAGAFVGIGRFRPERGGYYGRYEVKKIAWN